ncbi:hypothetical protein FRX31_009939, partial [Thalictrum thalictroides]
EELTTTRLHSLSQLDLSLYLIKLLEQTLGSLPKFQISQRPLHQVALVRVFLCDLFPVSMGDLTYVLKLAWEAGKQISSKK